ncbi:hypothetical protein GCM10010211_15200 [Streptomyces albospinus]|uniref:Secreted protein n=1 Tax=Streptomyces albospinus TaxID=285515 RepID=A0ABQ2USL3_9ACTN|nr:hypothetical protein [Streptomyces albospinus]GGU51479.1 hypothetical protein GCM10010211_15200 [Streptomyces albospinus]
MRKLHKAAAVAAVIGSVGFFGAGTASAQPSGGHGGGCRNHEINVDVLGEVGILNGLLGNALNGEGNAGGQVTGMGNCGM